MAVKTGVISIFILCLIACLIKSADAHLIMRRELPTTTQQQNAAENRTTTTLTLQTPQNVNLTRITKLTAQSGAKFSSSTDATDTNRRDYTNPAATESTDKIRLPSTTAAMPNTIDTEQEEFKEKHKTNIALEEKLELKLKDAPMSFTTETETNIPVLKDLIQTTTEASLLEHKSQLSLEDSNEIQISNTAKQPKFLNDNSTNSNSLNLPNTADAWTLIGMKSISRRTNQSNTDMQTQASYLETSNNKSSSLLDAIKEKTLTDWTQIVQMSADKSVGNALTEDDDSTTLQHTTLAESTSIKSTTTTFNIEKTILLNETTNVTPATSVNNTPQSVVLSAIDNVDSMTALKANDTRYLEELSAKNEEKIVHNEEHDKELKSAIQEENANTTTTTTTTSPTMMTTTLKMTTFSTPATALVSTTVSSSEQQRRTDIDVLATGINENDNKNANLIDEFETTTISGSVEIAKTIKATTNIPLDIITSTTTNVEPSNSTKNVKELINLTATTDIDQITNKTNLETPTIATTTTTANLIESTTTTTTTAIETTPTTSVQSKNSSAITNQSLAASKDDDDIDNDVTSATTDSLSAQSTSSLAQIFSTITPKTTTTTTTTEKIATSVTKDTITSTLTSNLTQKQQQQEIQSNETTIETTTIAFKNNQNNNVFESPISFSTTAKPVDRPETQTEVDSSTTTTTTIRNMHEINNATIPADRESTSTEAILTNFIDDSTTTTTTSTSTTTKAPNSSISLTTLSTLTTSTPNVLSVQTTNTAEFETVYTTETTPLITEQTPTETITTTTTTTKLAVESTISSVTTSSSSTSTTTELPVFIAPKTTTTETATSPPPTTTITTTTEEEVEETTTIVTPTTTLKTIEMIPVATRTTQFEAAAIPTTLDPLNFPNSISVLHAQPPKSTPDNPETDVNAVIAISVSVIGVVALILLVAFLYLMRKRQKATSYGQRCRPVSLDAYSLDNVSVLGSVRRKGALRASKRSYGNAAFDDPSLRHNVLQTAIDLSKFVERRSSIFEEFRDVPQIIARPEEIPEGCENKNRYANVIPLPETRVILQRRNDDDTTEYINANYVRGPKDAPNYYIACQAPLESTVQDFWRMIWEQQSRVIIQATDLIENGAEKCAEYLPPSVTLDNHTTFGDFQVTLKNREVKDKYAISTIMLKNTISNTSREITHYWYKWPEIGVPSEEAPIIAMLLEARSSLKSYALEVTNELKEKSSSSLSVEHENGDTKESLTALTINGAGPSGREINGNVSDKAKNIARNQGPLTIHCSPGTGRTGTIISCDIAIRSLETTKSLDIPQIVYYIRRGRASAVQTKEQYEFIYKVANVYAMKITNVPNDN